MDQVKFVKGSLEKTLLGPFMNTLIHRYKAEGLFKYIWPFSGHQALRGREKQALLGFNVVILILID